MDHRRVQSGHLDLPGRGRTYVRHLRGPKGAPAILLLHGLGVDAQTNWDPVMRPLAHDFSVWAMDIRGHGRGIPLEGKPFRLGDAAIDAMVLLSTLQIRNAIVAGYSMGGPIALLTARQGAPRGLVSGLVLTATSDAPIDVPPYLADFWAWLQWTAGAKAALTTMKQGAEQVVAFDGRAWTATMRLPSAVVVTVPDPIEPTDNQVAMARRMGSSVRWFPTLLGHFAAADPLFPATFVPACTEVGRRAELLPLGPELAA